MSDIKESFYFDQHNDDEYTLTQTAVQEVGSIKQANFEESQRSNGFSDGRTQRKVMSLPVADYLNALKMGYGLDSEDPTVLKSEMYRFLKEKGSEAGFQTVSHILTPGAHSNIIIK
jgi:hypothetical protein